PVLVAALLGGFGPGLFATVASLAGHILLSLERGVLSHSAPEAAAAFVSCTIAFAALGLGIAWFGHRSRDARDKAAAREAHLRSILDTVPDAMIVIDTRGVLQSFSAAAETLFGYGA